MPEVQKVRQPDCFERFRCIGAECEDTCCGDWGVLVDKITWEKYHSPFVQLIGGHSLSSLVEINPASKSAIDYARFRLVDARCPAFEDGWCGIQKALGEPWLGDICSTYPRVLTVSAGVVERSLHPSCPEAARLILTDPDGMALREFAGDPGPHRPGAMVVMENAPHDCLNEIRGLAIELIKERSRPLWQRIASFGFVIEKLACAHKAGAVTLLEDHLNAFKQGAFDGALNDQKAAPALQIEWVVELIVGRISSDYTSPRFIECYREFMRGLGWTAASTLEELADRYDTACQNNFLPFIQKHEHLFENYLVNHIFRTFFPYRRKMPDQPGVIDSSPEAIRDAFLLLAVHYAIVHTVLIGMAALHRDELNSDHAVKLVQSYAKAFLHSSSFDSLALEFLHKKAEGPTRLAALLVMD